MRRKLETTSSHEYLPWRDTIPYEKKTHLRFSIVTDFITTFLQRSEIYLNYHIDQKDEATQIPYFSQLSHSESDGWHTICCSSHPLSGAHETLFLFGVSYKIDGNEAQCSVVGFDQFNQSITNGPSIHFDIRQPSSFSANQDFTHLVNVCSELEDFLSVLENDYMPPLDDFFGSFDSSV